MVLLSVEGLECSFGEKVLFSGLKFAVEKGEKLALVAPNGTGKSSLLRILAGIDAPVQGRVVVSQDLRIGYLEQDPVFPPDETVEGTIARVNAGIHSKIREYEELMAMSHETISPAVSERIANLAHELEELNAWDFDRRIVQLLSVFEVPQGNRLISSLSGGQRKRLAMATCLGLSPDLLLLDEPTNHLDIAMTEWLEKYLSGTSVSLLMVTHDRYFLDRVCTGILELNEGKLFEWKGNYSYFLEKRSLLDETIQAETEKARNLLRKELDWMRRMPKARSTKAKSRIDAFYELKEKASRRPVMREMKLEMGMARLGSQILEVKGISKAFGQVRILDDFSYTFSRGERIGIIGPNGVGKTTLLNLFTLAEPADKGTISVGETIRYGYYKQEGIRLADDKRVIEVLKDVAEFIELGNGKTLSASQLLLYFMFTPEQQYTFVSKLSGGERRRLHLLMVLMQNPNFLILDEPTNDLDLFTMNRLEEFLSEFGGCLLIVSHDRYFMDKLVDQLFIMQGNGQISGFTGTYTEYREFLDLQESEAGEKEMAGDPQPAANTRIQPAAGKRKLTYREKLEFETLDKEIPQLEQEKAGLVDSLHQLGSDFEKISAATSRIEEITRLLDAKSHRWLELSEFI
ncbi:MAG: ABC-F family ATP-binding cassette domain-containing protein [Bacteroidales bacterium]